MKGTKILCIVLSLAAVFSLLLVRDSVAWLDTTTGTPASGVIHVKKMAFSFDGSLGTYLQYNTGSNAGKKYVVTEQNLIVTNGGKITVTNYSTIATEARFKITYQAINPTSHAKETRTYTGAAADSLSATIDSHWLQTNNDGYFYYYASGDAFGTPGFAAVGNTAPSPVDAITEIKYRDSLSPDVLEHSDYFQNDVPFAGTVHVIFEAKQANHVDWSQITSW